MADKRPVGSKCLGDFGYKLLFRLRCIRKLDLIRKTAAARLPDDTRGFIQSFSFSISFMSPNS